MILDLGVGFRGYYSDNARTIAVGGEPTDAQQRAWQAVDRRVRALSKSTARPGVSCRELFEAVAAAAGRVSAVGVQSSLGPRRRTRAARRAAPQSALGRHAGRGRFHRGRAGAVPRGAACRHSAGAELSGDARRRRAADRLAAGAVTSGTACRRRSLACDAASA